MKFFKFALIGAALMLTASLLNGILIDLMQLPAGIIAPIVIIAFFVLKYIAYLHFEIIHPNFRRYVMTNIPLTAFIAWLIPAIILHSPLNAAISTALVLGFSVALRYAVFRAVRLITD